MTSRKADNLSRYKMPKKILFLTGTRADFGKLKPLISEVANDEDFEYRIFATGTHMLSRFGSTVIEIEKSGFKNVFSYINQEGSLNTGMDLALANTIHGLGLYIREFPPDMIIVHGDRIEALAGAIVGALRNVLVAHIEGGEVSGTVDELLRHSISKLSHIHFVANEEARTRLIQMGELPEAVYVTGSPDVDVMLSDELPHLSAVKEKYEIPFSQYHIFVYHPVTTELDSLKRKIHVVTNALVKSGLQFVVIHPNNDSGADLILECIEPLQDNPNFRVLRSMRFEYFLSLLKNTETIVGNSSVGIREAPVYGVPTINIGSRQMNRYRCDSIINVPEDEQMILDNLRNPSARTLPSLHFGNGKSAKHFLRELRDPALWRISRQKQFRDLQVANVLVDDLYTSA